MKPSLNPGRMAFAQMEARLRVLETKPADEVLAIGYSLAIKLGACTPEGIELRAILLRLQEINE